MNPRGQYNNDKERFKSVVKDSQSRKYDKFKHAIIVLAIALLSFGIIEFVLLDGVNAFGFLSNRPSQKALEYYLETYEDGVNTKGIYAMTRRLGCHDEILIYNKEGQPLTKFSYSNGRVYESKIIQPADL